MLRCLPALLLACLLPLAVGCGRGNKVPPAPSDAAKAKEALTQVLDAWRSGGKPDSVSGVIVSDEEWAGGAQLLKYEIQDGKAFGTSIRQKAMLEVRGVDGKTLRKSALYQISTNPVVTVNRSDAAEDDAGTGAPVKKTRE